MSIVHVKNKSNGTVYVYESTSFWDKEKNQPRNTRVCIGKIDTTSGEIIYNKNYVHNQLEKKGVVSSIEYKRVFCGASYLFDQIGEQLGIVADLKTCFPDIYKQILSIAYYLILEDKSPMSRFERWERTHLHPFGKTITSQRSSELFASITEDAKQRFFSLQSARRLEKEYLAYDTTSISSYSQSLKQVRYGVNKDHDPLAQINLALLLGQSSRLPVCYRTLPGNISDVSTIKKLLHDLEYLHIKKVKLVLDRGFYSESNINALYQHHYKFLLATKISLKLVKPHLDTVHKEMITRANYNTKDGLYSQTITTNWNYLHTYSRSDTVTKEKRRIYLHIYYNDQRATDDKIRVNLLLDRLEEELLTNNRDPKHEKLYSKYFTLHETPKKGIQVTPKEDAIKDKERYFGYFTLISNEVKSASEAIKIYRSKDYIEKAYDDLKNRLSLKRTMVSTQESLEGKLFIQFIALIFTSYIKKQMDQKDLFKKYTLQGLFDELDIIEQFTQPGKQPIVGEVTKKQQEIYDLLGVKQIS